MRDHKTPDEPKRKPTVRGRGLGAKFYRKPPEVADEAAAVKPDSMKRASPEPNPEATKPEPTKPDSTKAEQKKAEQTKAEPTEAAAADATARAEPEVVAQPPAPAGAKLADDSTAPAPVFLGKSAADGPAERDDAPHTSAPAKKPAKRHMSAATTRRVLAAAAIGAVVAAIATIFIAGGFGKDSDLTTHKPGEPTAGRQAGEAFLGAEQGDCLMWEEADGSDIGEVDCAQSHKFEVAGVIDLSEYPGAEFGPGAKFPDVLRFTELQSEHCDPAVADFLDSRFDPNGKFEVGSINPGQQNWDNGERTLLCGLKYVKPSGTFIATSGPVQGQDQSKIWDAGTCFGINQSQATDMVDCAQPHAFEVAGVVDLAVQFTGGPPTADDQEKYLNETCSKVVDEYLGSPDALRNKTLTAFLGEPLDPLSWLAGSRKVNCNIGKGTTDGFAPIVGTAKGDILIDGQPPVPPPAEPEGRALPTPLPGAEPPR